MQIAEKFGNRLRELRAERGVSQQQLADMAAVSRTSIAMYEAGKRLPDIGMLARLADCLGVDSAELLEAMQEQNEPTGVIVVEDMPALLRGTVRMAQEALPDAAITGFENAIDALAYAAAHSVRIAFLDIELDERMNGVELAKRLKELHPRVNIIFLTSFGEYAQDAHDLYSSAYVRKPITAEKIREALDNLRFPVRGCGQ